MPDAHMIGGLWKVDGYSRLLKVLTDTFEVVSADANPLGATNLLTFPYDWRQDNRISARRLSELVGPALKRWREYIGVQDAKVVLIGHSMGGLVARYYLEVLGGWPLCRALVTFGTPFRGAPQAIGYLANGYKRLHVDLTAAMRTFPSVYQLLPVYPAVRGSDRVYRRVAESGPLPNIDAALAADGLRFHREMEVAIDANRRADSDGRSAYGVLPVVGTHEPTFQSAEVKDESLSLSFDRPTGVDAFVGHEELDGDGTVPIVSAAPIDLSDTYVDDYQAEKHGALQRNPHVLENLVGRLTKMQARSLEKVRGTDPKHRSGRSALAVTIDDEFHPDEPIELSVNVIAAQEPAAVVAGFEPLADSGRADATLELRRHGDRWTTTSTPLTPGVYRVTVSAHGNGLSPPPVHDLIRVNG
jgi:pimeloyl-ACP methyl ester carboxylesterase